MHHLFLVVQRLLVIRSTQFLLYDSLQLSYCYPDKRLTMVYFPGSLPGLIHTLATETMNIQSTSPEMHRVHDCRSPCCSAIQGVNNFHLHKIVFPKIYKNTQQLQKLNQKQNNDL